MTQIKRIKKAKLNEFLGASSGAHIASGSSGATGWSGISFGVQQTSVA